MASTLQSKDISLLNGLKSKNPSQTERMQGKNYLKKMGQKKEGNAILLFNKIEFKAKYIRRDNERNN